MAVKPIGEILATVSSIIGENTSDEALTLLEDITDTFNDKDNTDWKKKYEDNDKEWRNRYKERFLSGDTSLDPKPEDEEDPEPEKPLTFENLFKEG